MSIATQLTAAENNIKSAYTALQNKGATIPANKNLSNLSSTINSISGGGTINNQDKSITENGEYTADSGYTGLGTVTVNVDNSLEELQAQLDIEKALAGGASETSSDTRDSIEDNLDEFLYGNHSAEKTTYDITFNLSNSTQYDMIVKDLISEKAWAVRPGDPRMLNLDSGTSVNLVFYGFKFSADDVPTITISSTVPSGYTITTEYDAELGHISKCAFTAHEDVQFNCTRTDEIEESE